MRRIDDLTEMAAREKCRLASAALTHPPATSITRTVRLLEPEVCTGPRALPDALVAASESLSADRELLESVSGIGRQTATTILAELPAVERLPLRRERRQPTAVLSPRQYQGGTSVEETDAAVEERATRAAAGVVHADTDGGAVQPTSSEVLREAGGGREDPDAGHRRACANW